MTTLTAKFENDGRFFAQGRNGSVETAGIEFMIVPNVTRDEDVYIGFLNKKGSTTINGGARLPASVMDEICKAYLKHRGFLLGPDTP